MGGADRRRFLFRFIERDLMYRTPPPCPTKPCPDLGDRHCQRRRRGLWCVKSRELEGGPARRFSPAAERYQRALLVDALRALLD